MAAAQKSVSKRPDYAPYLSHYHAAWFGNMTIYQRGAQIWLSTARPRAW